MFNFDEAGFLPPMEQQLFKQYQTPTTIQSISWPVAMSGRDIISIARTGSGKTLGVSLGEKQTRPADRNHLVRTSEPTGPKTAKINSI